MTDRDTIVKNMNPEGRKLFIQLMRIKDELLTNYPIEDKVRLAEIKQEVDQLEKSIEEYLDRIGRKFYTNL